MDKVIRARYDEVIDIYGWLGDFTVRLDPDHCRRRLKMRP